MKSFSTGEVRHWIGSDHTSSDELIELITELVNKEYPIDQIREDIINSDLGDGSLDGDDDDDAEAQRIDDASWRA
jgi:hypothetical protein